MASIAPGASSRGNVVALPDLGPTELVESMPAGEAVLVVVRPAAARFLVLEPAIRKGEDAESVHDMRVAIRRVRTALRLFEDMVPGWADGLRNELRWIAQTLGRLRDLDVQRGWLVASSEDVPAEDRAVLHVLDDVFVARRIDAQNALVDALDSTRFERRRTELATLARGPGLASVEAQRPIGEVASPLVVRRYRAMQTAGRKLGPHSPTAKLHAFRIRTKRVRYAIEFVAPLYGKPAFSLTKQLTRLQDLLGDLHDAELAAHRLREYAAEPDIELPANAAFVLGALSERSARRARKLRRRFPKRFERVRGDRWKDLKKTMTHRAE